jgi:hypothetical protein
MQDIWDDVHTQEEGIVEYHTDDEPNPDPQGRSPPPDRAVV